ncbi:hypothetical protein BC834DRAFT_237374 [Gloeopeniophorella convolvens]|nr:hypothetical protein BC834DRAFT_237374 [Gloeopeniophorella convolvens]
MSPKMEDEQHQVEAASLTGRSNNAPVGIVPTDSKTTLLNARALKRKALSDARRAEGEKHKEEGNIYFRAGEYHKAIEEYQTAVKKHGPRAVYLSNLAAAWLKLEEWDAAEDCATRALEYDPTFVKARWRRALARKGNLQLVAATVDLTSVLKLDPTSAEAKATALEIGKLLRARGESHKLRDAVSDNPLQYMRDARPFTEQDATELESISDSSDCQHEGNGEPCRSYNHDGCSSGTQCVFSHAPDYNSVRDELGRNVCLNYLLETCKLGVNECVYAHEMTYLRRGGWWDNPKKRSRYRATIVPALKMENSINGILMLSIMENRYIWNWPELAALDAELRNQPPATLAWGEDNQSGGPCESGDSDDKMHQRSEPEQAGRPQNYGFSREEVQELLGRGFKPWEERSDDVVQRFRLSQRK